MPYENQRTSVQRFFTSTTFLIVFFSYLGITAIVSLIYGIFPTNYTRIGDILRDGYIPIGFYLLQLNLVLTCMTIFVFCNESVMVSLELSPSTSNIAIYFLVGLFYASLSYIVISSFQNSQMYRIFTWELSETTSRYSYLGFVTVCIFAIMIALLIAYVHFFI